MSSFTAPVGGNRHGQYEAGTTTGEMVDPASNQRATGPQYQPTLLEWARAALGLP